MKKYFIKIMSASIVLLSLSFFFSIEKVSALTTTENYNHKEKESNVAKKESFKNKMIQPNCIFFPERSIPDGIYYVGFNSPNGRFNAGYDIIVKDNTIIAAGNPWERLYGLSVTYKELKIINPKRATYFLNVTDGRGIWRKALTATINGQGSIDVYLGNF